MNLSKDRLDWSIRDSEASIRQAVEQALVCRSEVCVSGYSTGTFSEDRLYSLAWEFRGCSKSERRANPDMKS